MTSGIELALGTSVEKVPKGKSPEVNPTPIPKVPEPAPQSTSFFAEFLRVQSDKMILIGLIVFLHFSHADDRLQAGAIGALIALIQGQRFRWAKQ